MKEELLKLLNEEIEFARKCDVPQFVMGLCQARKIISEYKPEPEDLLWFASKEVD